MKKYSNILIVLLTFIILITVFLNKELVSSTVLTSYYIWFNTLLPSMLPMIILSDILINYNFINYIPKLITKSISKILNISNNAVLILFLSLISGFPINAINISLSLDKNLISKKEAEHLLLFTSFSNPLFILETVGIFYLKNNTYGIIILISHILSNFIIAIIFRNKNIPTKNNYISAYNKSQNFNTIFTTTIKKSVNTLLNISVTVCIFLILSTLITKIFNLNDLSSTLVKGILEMTMGLSSLSKLHIADIYKVILSTMFISFGGLSIHMQIVSVLDDKIKYKNFFLGRIYQAFISGVLSFIIIKFFM